MTKANIAHSTIWSKDFTDDWAKSKLAEWLSTGAIVHDTSHVRDLPALPASPEKELGEALAAQLQADKAILAVFDEGCMGMYNAIIDDELLNPTGIYKERLSQSALVAEMNTVSDDEAAAVRTWLDEAGMTFHVDTDEDWKREPHRRAAHQPVQDVHRSAADRATTSAPTPSASSTSRA